MKFIVDECTGPAVAQWLHEQGHEVLSVFDELRGINDDEVIAKAVSEGLILITNDKDFGEKVFREGKVHHGVILMRLADERAVSKIEVLRKLLKIYATQLQGNFVVVTEEGIRIAKQNR